MSSPIMLRRSNRSSTAVVINRTNLQKLGEQKDTDNWMVKLNSTSSLALYQCSICAKIFCEIVVREQHEETEHCFPPESTNSLADLVYASENSNTEQQDFLLYFNLVKRVPSKAYGVDQLANRTHLLKGLKTFGNVPGSYKCYCCEYKTCRAFILWAHISNNHIESDCDTNSRTFCFVCDKELTKRTNLFKHLQKCVNNSLEEETTSGSSAVEKFACNYCDTEISSLSHLERHLWEHVPT